MECYKGQVIDYWEKGGGLQKGIGGGQVKFYAKGVDKVLTMLKVSDLLMSQFGSLSPPCN